jgi:pimeloyl-ACP methyl ester carboxylesterase
MTANTDDPRSARAGTRPGTAHLDVPGGRLFYEVRGSGPLLLVIGQPMTSAPFAPLADLLATDRTVVTYDPHGLGSSTTDDPARDVTPQVQAEGLARLVDALGGGPADVFASSGGAVTALALAARHPQKVRTVIAHEPPVTELLPDAAHVRAVVDGIEQAYLAHGSGAAWGAFVSLVMHDGPVPGTGVQPASWPPRGAAGEGDGGQAGDVDDGPDGGAVPEPTRKQRDDDELFFLHMLKPFTRYEPDVAALRSGAPRIVVAVGATSRGEVARRSADALAERLGSPAVVFPGDHGGFTADPAGFATTIRQVLGG